MNSIYLAGFLLTYINVWFIDILNNAVAPLTNKVIIKIESYYLTTKQCN